MAPLHLDGGVQSEKPDSLSCALGAFHFRDEIREKHRTLRSLPSGRVVIPGSDTFRISAWLYQILGAMHSPCGTVSFLIRPHADE